MNFTNFLDSLWTNFAFDLAIDLGTANTLVYVKGKGIVIHEPSAVAQHKKTKEILAIGRTAKEMIGKTPGNILAIRPLRDGVISDFEVAEGMLRYFIKKVHQTKQLFPPRIPRPRVVIGIPSGVTEVERKAVVDAALRGGARKVYLLEEPMAAALGANLPVDKPQGSMIVDIGGGTTEIAVISLGGMVVGRSLRVAGNEMDEQIVIWAKEEHDLLIGERTAEEAKIAIGSAWGEGKSKVKSQSAKVEEGMEGGSEGRSSKDNNMSLLRGRDLGTGLPKQVSVSRVEIRRALQKPLRQIVFCVKEVIEETPPELLNDIARLGILLTGGSALLEGIDRLLAEETKMPIRVVDEPLTTVVRGCGKALDDVRVLERLRVAWGS